MSDASRQALADALERAKGPDRLLDCRIWLIVGESLGSHYDVRATTPVLPSECIMTRTFARALEDFPDDVSGVASSWRVPWFTGSVDAARTLMANIGYVMWRPLGKTPSVATQNDTGWSDYSFGYSEPLAISAAAIRAGGPVLYPEIFGKTDA